MCSLLLPVDFLKNTVLAIFSFNCSTFYLLNYQRISQRKYESKFVSSVIFRSVIFSSSVRVMLSSVGSFTEAVTWLSTYRVCFHYISAHYSSLTEQKNPLCIFCFRLILMFFNGHLKKLPKHKDEDTVSVCCAQDAADLRQPCCSRFSNFACVWLRPSQT